jgi:uncharacterized protein YbjT (DUF2867 family)
VKVLVIGATGELGGAVARTLSTRGDVSVRAFVRRPLPADGPPVDDVVLGDLGDPESLDRACHGASSMFLVSSPTTDQVELETNAIAAAERARVERIVKVSNIPIAGLETGLHGNHRAIERRLAASSCAAVVLQPSFFASVIGKQADVVARGHLVLPTGAGKIAWIEPADIAAVGAEALVRTDLERPLHLDEPLHLTGPEALDGDDVAARLGVTRLDVHIDRWRESVVASGLDPWLADSTVHLFAAIARGALAEVTGTVEQVLGRPPQRVFAD